MLGRNTRTDRAPSLRPSSSRSRELELGDHEPDETSMNASNSTAGGQWSVAHDWHGCLGRLQQIAQRPASNANVQRRAFNVQACPNSPQSWNVLTAHEVVCAWTPPVYEYRCVAARATYVHELGKRVRFRGSRCQARASFTCEMVVRRGTSLSLSPNNHRGTSVRRLGSDSDHSDSDRPTAL